MPRLFCDWWWRTLHHRLRPFLRPLVLTTDYRLSPRWNRTSSSCLLPPRRRWRRRDLDLDLRLLLSCCSRGSSTLSCYSTSITPTKRQVACEHWKKVTLTTDYCSYDFRRGRLEATVCGGRRRRRLLEQPQPWKPSYISTTIPYYYNYWYTE